MALLDFFPANIEIC